MNEQEAEVLEDAAEWTPPVTIRGTAKWITLSLACLLVLGLLAYGVSRWTLPVIVLGAIGAIVLVAGIICTYIIIASIQGHVRWSRVGRDFRQRDVPEIRAALQTATVQVTTVRATAVATIEQFEDEGHGFIFDVGDGQLLFLKGQEYRPVDDAMPWPNTEFEIVRSTVGDRWIGIFCTGAALAPTTVLQSSDCKEEIIWAIREDVITAPMDEFLRSIRVGI
jgi:hypothetical protein